MTNQLRRCVLLLPGYELDGYPRSLDSNASAELLSGWVSLWHPSLIRTSQAPPEWQPADQAPNDAAGTLAVVPSISKADLHDAYRAFGERQDSWLVEPIPDWKKLQFQLLETTHLANPSEVDLPLVQELAPTFAALGYAFLQIQLMTRQLRYTSNLDQSLFSEQLILAAESTLGGDRDKAVEMLQSCFDSLGQERDHYYSLDVSLLDVTLLAPTTLGKSLAKQLSTAPMTSYLASAELLRGLAAQHSDSFQALLQQLQEQRCCLVGGLDQERPHPLMSREAFYRDLARGRMSFEELELESPGVFGRLSYGLAADHPAALKRNGFEAALLIAWSGGTYPEGSQAKMSWEAADGTYLPAIATRVLDAADPASFLSLGWDTGEALDHQHVPTMLFAHWPNHYCDFYELLHIVSDHTPALGKWSTAASYFKETDQPYHQERLNAHSFRFDWLCESNPNTRIVATKRFHLLQARCRSLQNLANLAWQLEQSPRPLPTHPAEEAETHPPYSVATRPQWTPELHELFDVSDSLLDEPEQSELRYKQALTLATALSASLCERFSKLITRLPAQHRTVDGENNPTETKSRQQTSSETGRLLFNPLGCPVRMRLQSEQHQEFVDADWKFASGRVGHDRFTCVDIPSMGFVAAPLADAVRSKANKQNPLVQAGCLIQNEFLEAQIDGSRGNLRTLHAPARRGNRLSMMIARRDIVRGKAVYSDMKASDVRMLTSSNMCGVVRATGKLELKGKRVADFEIDYEAWRGSRILEIVVRLSKLAPLADANPWKSAYVIRLAWPTEAAIVRAHNLGWRHSWPGDKCVSPILIEVDETDYRTHYLTGGLAFHRRTENRFLETVLPIGDEAIEHRFGLAVDLPYPQPLARDFIDARYAVSLASDNLQPAHGWLMNVDVKNVMIDIEAPLVDPQGQNVGIRLYLTECQGKSTSTTVRLMHPVASANRVNVSGDSIGKLTAKEDSFVIAMRSNEQCLVDVLWAKNQ